MTPLGVMRPTLCTLGSVNQRLPSGPAVMSNGLPVTGKGNSVMTPAVVMRPMRFPNCSVNHRCPSGPVTISAGLPDTVGNGNVGDDSGDTDSTDGARGCIAKCEPEIAVRPAGDAPRSRVARGHRKLGNGPRGRYPRDVAPGIGHPEITVRSSHDARWQAIESNSRELRLNSSWRQPNDSIRRRRVPHTAISGTVAMPWGVQHGTPLTLGIGKCLTEGAAEASIG